MKPFAYAVTLAGSKRTWLILASDEDALQPMRDAGVIVYAKGKWQKAKVGLVRRGNSHEAS